MGVHGGDAASDGRLNAWGLSLPRCALRQVRSHFQSLLLNRVPVDHSGMFMKELPSLRCEFNQVATIGKPAPV